MPVSSRWRLPAAGVAAAACVAALVWSFGRGERAPLLSAADLGFHELGHMLLGWLPGWLPAFAGTFLQLAVPLGLAAYFGFVRREEYAAALMLAWAGTSARDASVYIADAPYEALPLIGGTHDWAYILGVTNRLDWALPLAAVVWWGGILCVLGGLAVALLPFGREAVLRRHAALESARLARLPRREPRNPVIRPPGDDVGTPPSGSEEGGADASDAFSA